jgi:YD repeat-containing protein
MRDRHRVRVVGKGGRSWSQWVKLETDRVSHQRTQVEGLRIVDHHLGGKTTKWARDGAGRLIGKALQSGVI